MNLNKIFDIKTEGYKLSFEDWQKTQDANQRYEIYLLGANGFVTKEGIKRAHINGYKEYLNLYSEIEKILEQDVTNFFPSEIRGINERKEKIRDYYC